MKLIVPDYYKDFRCIARRCRHTCCQGWEIDVDDVSLERFLSNPEIASRLESDDSGTHIRLLDGERCPFLRSDGLCDMIIRFGEDMLCDICRDHPRFRNYFTCRIELGLGLVCEEAGRIILGRETPMRLIVLSDDGGEEEPNEAELWLLNERRHMLDSITQSGPSARLMEYLIYRHLPDALYDGRFDARKAFIESAYSEITSSWAQTDGSLEALVECARKFSYDVEYDDEVLENRLSALDAEKTMIYFI